MAYGISGPGSTGFSGGFCSENIITGPWGPRALFNKVEESFTTGSCDHALYPALQAFQTPTLHAGMPSEAEIASLLHTASQLRGRQSKPCLSSLLNTRCKQGQRYHPPFRKRRVSLRQDSDLPQ